MDPAGHLQVVANLLVQALEKPLAPKQREAVEAANDALRLAEERLRQAQELVLLSEVTLDDLDMGAANAAWADIPDDADTGELNALRSASPTLHTLHRKGIDIISVRRYGDEHLDVARLLGERCGDNPGYVRLLARTDAQSATRFNIDPSAANDMAELLRRLKAMNVLTGTKLLAEIPAAKPFWLEHAKLRPHSKPSRWQVQRGTASKDYALFFGGHWLTAYAFAIACVNSTERIAPSRSTPTWPIDFQATWVADEAT